MTKVMFFGRWNVEGIKVLDPGLADYITLTPSLVPRTGARYAKQRFYKSRVSIVERFLNKLMVPGHRGKKHRITSYTLTGKGSKAYLLTEKMFESVEARTKENPIKVFVKAIENAAPREEIVTIEYGGARYPKSVECSPQRRIDVALRNLVQGAFRQSFNSKKSAVNALTEEIINAYQNNSASNAIARKLDIERQADSSR